MPTSIFDPKFQRKCLLGQDKKLLKAANTVSRQIRALRPDPKYPEATPQAFLVGGFVRDALLGLHPKDADVEVYGVSAKRLEDFLNRLYPGKVNTVGRAFGILKINLGEGLEFDVSIPRRESKVGKGHKGFAVQGDPGMSIKEAARRRDFTINALAADPLTGGVLNLFHGLEDLKARVLRVTNEERFQDDSLRVYRALQFAARMDLSVEKKSLALMRKMVKRGDLRELSKERVTEELKKLLLKAEKPSIGFELARELGIIQRDYPELHGLIGLKQEKEWHPEGHAWEHTLMALDEAAKIIRQPKRQFSEEEKLQVVLGVLCHDFGKPATTKLVKGKIRSLGHEEAGEEPARKLCERLSFAKETENAAVMIAREHLKPSMLYFQREKGILDDDQYANAARRLLKRTHPVSWRVLLAASEADLRGRLLPGAKTKPYRIGDLMRRVILKRGLDKEPTKPLVRGRDLLNLGLEPGPRMGELIRQVENFRDEGKIKTREEALAYIKKRLFK